MKNNLDNYHLQKATIEDIPKLVDHNRQMFTEIWSLRDVPYEPQNLATMDQDYKTKLEKELPAGTCVAWVIKDNQRILASGSVSFVSMVPTPTDPQCRVAYVHSLFTDSEYRRNGLSNYLMKEIVAYCQSQGIKRLILNTSQAGKGNYEKIGFKLADNSMRMHL